MFLEIPFFLFRATRRMMPSTLLSYVGRPRTRLHATYTRTRTGHSLCPGMKGQEHKERRRVGEGSCAREQLSTENI